MEFTLTYRGPLPSFQKKGAEKKKKIQFEMRQDFHRQIANRWQNLPYLKTRGTELPPVPSEGDDPIDVLRPAFLLFPPVKWKVHFVGRFVWLPLVIHSDQLHLTCHLDIKIKSVASVGDILGGGDLDNRVKLLLDALTLPQEGQLPTVTPENKSVWPISAVLRRKYGGGDIHDPIFCCLLEDDKFVSRLNIQAEPLLSQLPEGTDRSWAEVEIGVFVKATDTSPTHPGQF